MILFFIYFRFKHLPKGQPLSGDQLRAALDNITENFNGMSSQLQKLGSTQSNENFNNIVASNKPEVNPGFGWGLLSDRYCIYTVGLR